MTRDPKTDQFEDLWVPPVEDRTRLPDLAREGQLCFVQREGQTYIRMGGRWVRLVPA